MRDLRLPSLLAALVLFTNAAAIGPTEEGLTADDCGSGGDAPGDDIGAVTLMLPVHCTGEMVPDDTGDVYLVQLEAGDAITVRQAANDSIRFALCARDVRYDWEYCSYGGANHRLERLTTPVDATYAIRVHDIHGDAGPYTLVVEGPAGIVPQNDCLSGGDAPDLYRNGTFIRSPFGCDGEFTYGSLVDVYKFEAFDRDHLSVNLSKANTTRVDLCLVDEHDDVVTCSEAFRGTTQANLSLMIPKSGVWGISLFAYAPSTYNLSGTLTSPPVDDCFTGGDASDLASDPSQIQTPMSRCEPTIAPGDPADWYSFDALEGEPINVSLVNGETLRARACLHTPDGALTGCTGHAGGVVNFTATVSGRWRIHVDPNGTTGRYSLSAYVDFHRGLGNNHAILQHFACFKKSSMRVECAARASDDEPMLVYDIGWGDGGFGTAYTESGRTVRWQHTYTTPGEYRITVNVAEVEGPNVVPLTHALALTRTIVVGSGDPSIHRVDWQVVPAPEITILTRTDDVPLQDGDTRLAVLRVPLPYKLPASHDLNVRWTGVGPMSITYLDSQFRALGTCDTTAATASCELPVGTRILRAAAPVGAPGDLRLEVA